MKRSGPALFVFSLPLLASLLLVTRESAAYVGPGAGLGMLGSLLALILAVFTAFWVLFRGLVRKVLRLPRAKPSAKPQGEQPKS